MERLSKRDKLILAGLFLSKFDEIGLKTLGFGGFTEAFNTIALSLKASPASLKNYRDEFDPYFPNPRKGWHRRPIRQYCKRFMDEYDHLSLADFAAFVRSEVSELGDIELVEKQIDPSEPGSFAKRLVTGQAAESYFEKVYSALPQFQHYGLANTTRLGCGFDFKMTRPECPFLAVEVKGMATAVGAIQLTDKEYRAAQVLEDRFFLFVVRNFVDRPFHTIYQDPAHSDLRFDRRESVSIQITWSTSVGGRIL
jgi:hypothetical protein